MTLFSRVTEICRERLPSIRVARITIDSIYDLDRMLQPGIRFGVTVRNTSELIGTPIAQIEFFYFSVDVMDGDERMIIQRMETWRNGTYKAFYRIFYDEVCQTRLDGLDGVELGWRDYWQRIDTAQSDFLNLTEKVPPIAAYYLMNDDASENQYAYNYVPEEYKIPGITITFKTATSWEIWQFIGTDITTQWDNLDYWLERSNYTLTKAAIEERLVGHITTHTHGITNLTPAGTVTLLLDAINAVPASNRVYGHMVTFKDEAYGWQLWQFIGTNILAQFEDVAYWQRIDTAQSDFLNLTEKVPPTEGYYLMSTTATLPDKLALNHVPAEYHKLGMMITFHNGDTWEVWQFIGDDIETQWNNVDYWLKIPVGPSLALGEELGTAYEGSKGKANADAIASIASKLGGIQDNAEVNQNAFSRIKVGSSTIASTDKTDTFELVEGSNITLSSSGKKITISSSYEDTTHDDLYANKAGDSNQDFSTKNLNVAGYVQVGSAQIVYVPEDSGTGTQGYIKIQHADGSTAMHLVTTGGQTLYSTGVPAAIEEHLRNVYRLLYFGGEPPMEDVVTGEQYYDTVEDKIHTAINTEVGGEFLVWDIGGVAPKENTLYVSESDYIYNTCRLWLYKEGYMRSLGIVQPQMDNAIFLSKNDEVMVIYNTSEEKADIIIGDRVKNRFMVIVPSTTSGAIVVNMIFNSIVPFGFLAEYEIYLYIESENVTNTLLSTECPLEPSETYSSGLILGTLQSTDIIGKGLHKLTYIRDRAAADTHMGLYVKHEYFEKL